MIEPKFNIHQPPSPQTGEVKQLWVELDPQDGSNFQTHLIVRVTYDEVNANWKVETQTYAVSTTKDDKEAAIKEAMKILVSNWAAS